MWLPYRYSQICYNAILKAQIGSNVIDILGNNIWVSIMQICLGLCKIFQRETLSESRKPSSWTEAPGNTQNAHPYPSDSYQLPRVTVYVELCPSASAVRIFLWFQVIYLPSTVPWITSCNPSSVCFLKQISNLFFKRKCCIYCIIYGFPFFFNLKVVIVY